MLGKGPSLAGLIKATCISSWIHVNRRVEVVINDFKT